MDLWEISLLLCHMVKFVLLVITGVVVPGRWVKHDLIGRKPVMEFLGPDVEKVSMKIQLRTDHGINPESELGRLRKMRDTGAVFPFILGGAPVSDNYWLLEDIGENVSYWRAGGKILSVSVDITLTEYSTEEVR